MSDISNIENIEEEKEIEKRELRDAEEKEIEKRDLRDAEEKEIKKRDSDKMGTEPIHKMLIKLSLPLMLSMLVQALYNVVDSIFVAHINEDALTAVTLCNPFQLLNMAFGIGTAVGMSALLSRYLGARKYDKAEKVAHNGFVLVAINYAIFFIVGCLARPIIEAQTNDSQIIEYAVVYLQITQWLSVAPMTQSMLERLLQSTGKTKYILFVQGSGAIFNCIMDPILIFGYFGFPAMGVKGAALATVFGQLLGCALGLYFNKTKNRELGLSWRKIKPHWQTMKDIYKIGIPTIVMQSVGSVMNFGMNQILMQFSSTAVATFGVYFKLQSFVFMPTFGLNAGSVPLIAYNYGAGRRDRLEEAMRLNVRYGIGLMSIGTLIFWIFPEQMMALFDASPEMAAMGVVALHIMSLNFPFAGYCIMRGAAFQALGKSVYTMYISITRQLVVILPLAYLLARSFGVNAVWWAFPMAEVVGTTMSVLFTRKIRRDIIDRI